MTTAGISKIVLAANADEDQPWAADAAAQLAKETDSQVAVVSVDDLETEMLSTMPRSEFRRFAQEAAERAAERVRAAGVEASVAVLSGPAVDGILEFAEREGADLIVVASSSRGHVAQRVLGSVPLSLVQRSSTPVMIVTHPAEAAQA
jgi:nucleotide-binding universal stress UspA family protein